MVPPEYEADAYVDLVKGEMLDACAPHARWIDVFCEHGAFDGEQTRAILEAGIAKGLVPRVHANQLQHGPGVQIAVELGAASADHVTHVTDADVDALANSDTVATLLPGAEFSTRATYPDARRLLDAGVTVALAADCNPGSSYTTNIPFCIAIAVREMHMTPDEAVWAATAGGARALRRTDIGHLGVGARADAVLLDAPSHIHLAYRPGRPARGRGVAGGRAGLDRRREVLKPSERSGVGCVFLLVPVQRQVGGHTAVRSFVGRGFSITATLAVASVACTATAVAAPSDQYVVRNLVGSSPRSSRRIATTRTSSTRGGS